MGQTCHIHPCPSVFPENMLSWMEENGGFEVVRSVERTKELFAQEEYAFLTITTFRSVQRRTRLFGAQHGLQAGSSLPLISIFISRFFLV